jgi:eukaryotic-like serine/threonine-protein kinase
MTAADFLARYQFNDPEDKIGSGGFGNVFKAQDSKTGKMVAIKISPVQNHSFSLKREVESSYEIEGHHNVLNYRDYFREERKGASVDYAVMKYYEHGSLEDLLRKNPKLSIDEKKQLIEGIFEGVKHLHR